MEGGTREQNTLMVIASDPMAQITILSERLLQAEKKVRLFENDFIEYTSKLNTLIAHVKQYITAEISPDLVYQCAKDVAVERYGISAENIQDVGTPSMAEYPDAKHINDALKQHRQKVTHTVELLCHYLLDKSDGGRLGIREAQQVTGITNVAQYSQRFKLRYSKDNKVRGQYREFSQTVNTKIGNETTIRCSGFVSACGGVVGDSEDYRPE